MPTPGKPGSKRGQTDSQRQNLMPAKKAGGNPDSAGKRPDSQRERPEPEHENVDFERED